MGTRSSIAVKRNDGKVLVVYCHYDGNTKWVGRRLFMYYDSQEKAEALIHHGDISQLKKSIDCPLGHSFATPEEDYTIFFGRDRGDDGAFPAIYSNVNMYSSCLDEYEQSYNYFWDGSKWWVKRRGVKHESGEVLTWEMCGGK